jgi:hypothetical protein
MLRRMTHYQCPEGFPRLPLALRHLWWTKTATTWSTTRACSRPAATAFSGRTATSGQVSSSSSVILHSSAREGPHSGVAASSSERDKGLPELPFSYWRARRTCTVTWKRCSWGQSTTLKNRCLLQVCNHSSKTYFPTRTRQRAKVDHPTYFIGNLLVSIAFAALAYVAGLIVVTKLRKRRAGHFRQNDSAELLPPSPAE